jgi:serine/threonine protein kinase/tetratricopeptide (TPR) repeat protein
MAHEPASRTEREQVLDEILTAYLKAVDAGQPPDRGTLLARHPELAADLERFFADQDAMARWAEPLGEPDASPLGESLPEALGDFRILREVGRGGMGIVYEAEQRSLGRRVALKVLPLAGTLDARQLQRFQNEARAAACLHHNNIVPVYFVGSERGVPFYAMQYIDGRTLAEVIRQLRQPAAAAPASAAEERTAAFTPAGGVASPAAATEAVGRQATLATGSAALGREHCRTVARLGVQAAEALDHAHQAGVVHRDIKPANLMLDGRDNLWVTDFGLAHVQTEASLTMTGDLVGTLRYMSPEQALAKRVAIDHRTDVYSLGVTLYELLTLQPAFGGKDRQELLRQIAFDEPKSPRRLNKAIPAELETIVLKAMAKNPTERYATAQELADDLRRYLDDKPIRARRPTLGQRLGRWSRRHQALVRSAAVVLLLAVVGLAASTVLIGRALKAKEAALEGEAQQRQLAEEKAAEADAVVNYLVNDLLGSAAPDIKLGRPVTVEQVLANAEKSIDSAFADRPRVEAAVQLRLGDTYLSLGKYPEAQRHLLRARELSSRWHGPTAPETLRAMNGVANVLYSQGQREEARKLHEEVLGRMRKVLGEDHPDTLASMNNLANVLNHLGKREEARRLHEEVLGRRRKVLGEDHPHTLVSMNNLAETLRYQGQWEEARKLHEEVLGRKRKVLGEDHPHTLMSMRNLATVLQAQGQWEEARRLYEEVLGRQRKVLGEDHPRTLDTMHNLATVLQDQGKWEEARKLNEEVLGRQRKVLGDDHPDTLGSMNNLASVLRDQGKWEEARKLHEEALGRQRKVLGEDYPDTLDSMNNLAWLLATCAEPRHRDPTRAVELASKATTLAPQEGAFWNTLGLARYRAGDWKGALQALQKSMELSKGGQSGDWFFLAMASWQLGEKEQARKLFEKAVAWMDKNQPKDPDLFRFRAEAATLLGIPDGPRLPEKGGSAGKK